MRHHTHLVMNPEGQLSPFEGGHSVHNFGSSALRPRNRSRPRTRHRPLLCRFRHLSDSQIGPGTAVDSTFHVLLRLTLNDTFVQTAQFVRELV